MMADSLSLPKRDGSQEHHLCEDRGISFGLKVFLSQGKRPVTRKPLGAISPVAVGVYAFPNSSPIW